MVCKMYLLSSFLEDPVGKEAALLQMELYIQYVGRLY